MNYTPYRNPTPPPTPRSTPGPTPPPPVPPLGKPVTVTGKLRVVSYLWKDTVVDNEFKTDGSRESLPKLWPGDNLRECRQWHGLDLTATFHDGKPPDTIQLAELSYSGKTDTCGLIGKTTVTARHVTEPAIGQDYLKNYYIEVKTLLGTRLGAFIPDLDATALPFTPSRLAVTHSRNKYLGNDSLTPQIYTYAYIRLYAHYVTGNFVSKQRDNGFLSQEEIIKKQIASSWIPEHHIYVNRNHNPTDSVLQRQTENPPLTPDMVKWIDTYKPGEASGFNAISKALKKWKDETPLKVKLKTAEDFKKRYPDYFIGTDFPSE